MTSEDRNLQSIYRSVSRESSPESADREILDLAHRKPQQFWQPFALAATVLLSFAFLANVGLLQPEMTPELPTSAADSSSNQEETDGAPMPARRETAIEFPAEAREVEAPAARSFAPASKALENRDDAADLARLLEDMKESERQSLKESPATAASRRGVDDLPQARYCSEAASASAASWYRCILKLREDGRRDAADFEQALLLTKFPEFEIR